MGAPPLAFRLDGWLIAAVLIALLVGGPIVSVVLLALDPVENIWPHLISTTLPRYLSNSVVLAVATARWLLRSERGPPG